MLAIHSPQLTLQKIHAFHQSVALAAFEAIKGSMEQQRKKARLIVGRQTGDAVLDEMFKVMHPQAHFLDELPEQFPAPATIQQGLARYVGCSLAVEEPVVNPNRYQGKFIVSVELRFGPNGDIYASPAVLYHMRWNNNLNKFAHRFNNQIQNHKIEAVKRPDVTNHFYNAYSFYLGNAHKLQRPW